MAIKIYYVDETSGSDLSAKPTDEKTPLKTTAKALTLANINDIVMKKYSNKVYYREYVKKANRNVQYFYRNLKKGFSLQKTSDSVLISVYKEANKGKVPDGGIDPYLDSL